MELNTLDGIASVPYAHDHATVAVGRYLEVLGHALRPDRERVIADCVV